ncbi:MAG: hypothetical protein L0221_19125, partial [Chloroflexi bacterium]|nr:hypothetical protein [Chloroflexota bacterium]
MRGSVAARESLDSAMRAVIDPGTAADRDLGDTTQELAELLAFGVQYVELMSDEDTARCPACRAWLGRVLPVVSAPLLPIDGCSVICGCRLAPLFLE